MADRIPAPLIAIVAQTCSDRETHASLDGLFMYAGAPGEPPQGLAKLAKAQAWLRRVNTDAARPLDVLGRLIEAYMEVEPELEPKSFWETTDERKIANQALLDARDKIAKALGQHELQYARGGKIVGALGSPSRTLEQFIRERDFASIEGEFDRALANVEASPREAVSAASNILESVCKVYIEDEGLEAPTKQDLKPVWSVVRKHLGFDPSLVEDQDLQTVLTGLIATVEGIGALRTHASSAHGAGKKPYRLEPRHARLAVHAAHTVGLFILESWQRRKTPK